MKNRLFLLFPVILLLIFLILISCSLNKPYNPADPYNTDGSCLSETDVSDIMKGTASVRQLRKLKDTFYNWQSSVKGNNETETEDTSLSANSKAIIMPATGKLLFTLKDNDEC